jgi:hypothetical protein
MPVADQMVQVGHACLEAGKRFDWPDEPCHLVVLAVPSKAHLLTAVAQLQLADIRYELFFEPDDDLGVTAVCTEPITGKLRQTFRRYPLWRETSSNKSISIRGPPGHFYKTFSRISASSGCD